MFSKRRRAASNPPQRVPANVSSSASLAATKAFVRDRESNPNLSNAAAAAALRTHATSPTPVGETITKRMVRRGSTSSNGSSAMQRPALQRQNSSGSMTERSFRNPSPGRGSPADYNAPPVPALPQNYSSGSHRRASSLEPAFRGGSPVSRGGGRGVSLDRGTHPATPSRGQRVGSSLAQVAEDDYEAGQRASVNFSRPMSPASAARQNASPPSSKGWFGGPVVNQEAVQRMASTSRPRTSSGVPAPDLHSTQQTVYNAATRTVSTHHVSRGVEGSTLNNGSMRAKPSGTSVESRSYLQQPARQQARGPVDPNSANAVFDPSTRTFIHKQDAMERHREIHQEPTAQINQYVQQHLEHHAPLPEPIHDQVPRTPSPAVQQRQQQPEAPAARTREESPLPRLETSARVRHSEDPPIRLPQQQYEPTPFIERQLLEDFAGADIHPATTAKPDQRGSRVAEPEYASRVGHPKYAPNQGSSYPLLAAPVIQTTGNNIAGQGHGSAHSTTDRGQSLSPPRNAHFAPVAVELAGAKHQPPPRSSSPAKSALKASPFVSRRGSSPVAPNGRLLSKGAPSEASDTTSEGGSRKKKDVRVSFEERPVVAGTSVYREDTPTTSVGLGASKWSPTREKDNEFEDFMQPRPALPSFGSVRDKERRARHDDEIPEKVTETVSSTPMSASMGSVGEPMHSSTDHAIAGIVAHDFVQNKSKQNDPLPPDVTTVEGSGYVSDSSEDMEGSPGSRKHGAVDDSSQILSTPEPTLPSTLPRESVAIPASIKEQVVNVPDIALLPATPSPYEKPEPVFQPMAVPGRWSADEAGATSKPYASTTTTHVDMNAPTIIPFPVPIQPPTNLRELIEQDDDPSDDNSSIYSDAYEDLSDTEGGFGSINAIVERPVVPSGGLMFSRHAEESVSNATSDLFKEVAPDSAPNDDHASSQGWATTQQHWSELSESRKIPVSTDQSQKNVPSAAAIAPVTTTPRKQEEPRQLGGLKATSTTARRSDTTSQPQQGATPLKSALKKTTGVPVAAPRTSELQMKTTMRGAPANQNRASQSQMRQSMRGASPRAESATEPHMRRTMRGGVETSAPAKARGQPSLRSSMRGNDAAPPPSMGLTASRYSMPPVEQKPPRAALQKRHIPSSAAPRPQSMPVAPPKAITPAQNCDSDSDASASSFQRTRARRNANQRTMRSSMRSGPTPSMRNTAPAPVPAPIRPISPPGSPSPALRKSMRPSSPTPEVPKSSKFSIRSLSPMGRFRSSKPVESIQASPAKTKKTAGLSKQPKPKSAPAAPAGRTKSAFKSRFADSSDEDEDERPSRFRSRFADSDSDDEPVEYELPPGLAPVRGIPRKAGDEDGDSTDLEEEEEVRPRTTPAAKEVGFSTATSGVTQAQKTSATEGQGSALSSGSLRDSKHAPSRPAMPSFDSDGKVKTKRGFFGLGKKKPVSKPSPIEATDVPADTTKKPSEISMPPQKQPRTAGGPLTPIDEDKDIGTPVQSSPGSKRSPKLQRRSTPEWPLPRSNIPVPPIPDSERPMSSDGITPRRPRFDNRQMSQASNITTATAPIVDASGQTVAYGRGGKKKKFQGLRRVFGLND